MSNWTPEQWGVFFVNLATFVTTIYNLITNSKNSVIIQSLKERIDGMSKENNSLRGQIHSVAMASVPPNSAAQAVGKEVSLATSGNVTVEGESVVVEEAK